MIDSAQRVAELFDISLREAELIWDALSFLDETERIAKLLAIEQELETNLDDLHEVAERYGVNFEELIESVALWDIQVISLLRIADEYDLPPEDLLEIAEGAGHQATLDKSCGRGTTKKMKEDAQKIRDSVQSLLEAVDRFSPPQHYVNDWAAVTFILGPRLSDAKSTLDRMIDGIGQISVGSKGKCGPREVDAAMRARGVFMRRWREQRSGRINLEGENPLTQFLFKFLPIALGFERSTVRTLLRDHVREKIKRFDS